MRWGGQYTFASDRDCQERQAALRLMTHELPLPTTYVVTGTAHAQLLLPAESPAGFLPDVMRATLSQKYTFV